MHGNGKAALASALAGASLIAGALAGALVPALRLPAVAAGFLGYVRWGGRAVSQWQVGPRRPAGSGATGPVRPTPTNGLRIAAAIALSLLAAPALAQQTIFNVPSADVLDPGKVYLEADELFRPTEPEFSSTTLRGVVGVVPHVEAGLNFGGLNAPGPAVPTATVAVKVQPLRLGDFALTAGGNGLFYLEGRQDGVPAGLGYGFASYRVPTLETRVEVGGWYASAGYAKASSTGGALATIEQPVPGIPGLTVAADWWSGVNSIGYVSPGLIYAFGRWTAYAAYSIKNGDPRGDAGLVELGYAF